MADYKDYLVQEQDNGKVLISEDVIASIAALAVRDIDGVFGLSATANFDISNIIGKKNLRKGIRVVFNDKNEMEISCNLIVKIGTTVMETAKKVQEAIASEVEAITGLQPTRINVNVCGVAQPKA